MGQQTAGNATDRRTAIRWMLRDLQALQAMLQAERCSRPACGASAPSRRCSSSTRRGSRRPVRWRCSPRSTASRSPPRSARSTSSSTSTRRCSAATASRGCEAQLDPLLALGHAAAEAAGLHIVLTGILPTIRKRDLSLDNMVPNPRYLALNDALRDLRGEDFYELHIKGADELRVRQDSVMAEACNASFQVHLQVDAGRVRQRVQHRPGDHRPDAGLRPPTRRCCSASDCGPRRGSRCSNSRSTPVGPEQHLRERSGPGDVRGPTGSARRSSISTARTSPASARCCRPTTTSIRWPSWPRPAGCRA